jgi:hypothetical protein
MQLAVGAHFTEDDRHVSQALGTIPAAPINILAQRAAKNNFPSPVAGEASGVVSHAPRRQHLTGSVPAGMERTTQHR